jgi:hypothetical protein
MLSELDEESVVRPIVRHKRAEYLEGCFAKLSQLVVSENKILGQAVDNGDCFFDAFRQQLKRLLGIDTTVKELRAEISAYAHDLRHKPDNWIKDYIVLSRENQNIDEREKLLAYEEYLEGVHRDVSMAEKLMGKLPIWGDKKLDGRILCELYNVNLRVLEVGYLEEEDPSDPNTYWDLEKEEQLVYSKPECTHTIELAVAPDFSGHYVPIFPKN